MASSSDYGYDELYDRHKSKEIRLYNDVFAGQDWQSWSLRRRLQELKKVAPFLKQAKRRVIATEFEQTSGEREKFASTFFSYQPKGRKFLHDWYHTTYLPEFISILVSWLPSKTKAPAATVDQQVVTLEQLSIEQKEAPIPSASTTDEEEELSPAPNKKAESVDSSLTKEVETDIATEEKAESLEAEALDKTGDEANLIFFLEELERLVDEAVDLWRRVAAGHLRLATAANCLYFIGLVKASPQDMLRSLLTRFL